MPLVPSSAAAEIESKYIVAARSSDPEGPCESKYGLPATTTKDKPQQLAVESKSHPTVAELNQTIISMQPYSLNTIVALLKFYDISFGLEGELLFDKSGKTQTYFYFPQILTPHLLLDDQINYFLRCQRLKEQPQNRRVCFLLIHDNKLIALIVSLNQCNSQITIQHRDEKYRDEKTTLAAIKQDAKTIEQIKSAYKQLAIKVIGHVSSGDMDKDPLLIQLTKTLVSAYNLNFLKERIDLTPIASLDPSIVFARQCINEMNGKDEKGEDVIREKLGSKIDEQFRKQCVHTFKMGLKIWAQDKTNYPAIGKKLFDLFKYAFLERMRQELKGTMPTNAQLKSYQKIIYDLDCAVSSSNDSFVSSIERAAHFSHVEFLLPLFDCAGGAEELLAKLDPLIQKYAITMQWEKRFADKKLFDEVFKRYPKIEEKILILLEQFYLQKIQDVLNVKPLEERFAIYQHHKQIAMWAKSTIDNALQDIHYAAQIHPILQLLKCDYPYAILDRELEKLIQANNLAAQQWEKQNSPENQWWRMAKENIVSMTKFLGLISTFSPRCARRCEEAVRTLLESDFGATQQQDAGAKLRCKS